MRHRTELHILWDGDVPGLNEHRLSMAAFAKPLQTLLQAARRVASNIVTEALDQSEVGARGGKYADAAKELDLELTVVEKGCARPHFVCTARPPPGTTGHLFDDLSAQTVNTLLDFIEDERKGTLRSGVVRKFLGSLPAGLTRQRYAHVQDGKEVRVIEFGQAALGELPSEVPYLTEVEGHLASATFEPRPEIRLKDDERGNTALQCAVTPEDLERAIALRHEPVRAMVLVSEKGNRLLWLRGRDEAPPVMTPEQRSAHIMTRWDEVLQRLAR